MAVDLFVRGAPENETASEHCLWEPSSWVAPVKESCGPHFALLDRFLFSVVAHANMEFWSRREDHLPASLLVSSLWGGDVPLLLLVVSY